MRFIYTLVFLLIFKILISNPIKDFVKLNNKFNTDKFVLITFNIQNCQSCTYPIQSIIKDIRGYNPLISIYLITNEKINEKSKKFYLHKIGVDTSDANIITDKNLYNYLLKKTKLVENISVVSINSKIEVIEKIDKDFNLELILKEIKDKITIKVMSKLLVDNNITDYSTSYNGVIFNEDNFVIFKKGVNLVSKYNYNGLYKNLFLDSISICNINFIKSILSEEEYINSIKFYNKNTFEVSKFFIPISIFKISEKEFGITYYIKTFKEGIYKNDSVIYESQKPFIAIIDTNLNLKKIYNFNYNISSKIILESQTAYSNSAFYFLCSNGVNKYLIGKFLLNNSSELVIDSLNSYYFSSSENSKLPIINNLSNKVLFTIYGLKSKNSSSIYKINNNEKVINLYTSKNEFIYGSMIYETKCGNLIFGTSENKIFSLKKIKLDNSNYSVNEVTSQFYFILHGILYQILYFEFSNNP